MNNWEELLNWYHVNQLLQKEHVTVNPTIGDDHSYRIRIDEPLKPWHDIVYTASIHSGSWEIRVTVSVHDTVVIENATEHKFPELPDVWALLKSTYLIQRAKAKHDGLKAAQHLVTTVSEGESHESHHSGEPTI